MPRLTAFLITFCIGVGATLIWQAYGEMTGISSPQFRQQQLKAIALDVGVMRQNVDRISITQERVTHNVDQLMASHERMTREFTKLQAIQQDILQKISGSPPRSEAATERKAAPRSSQARPAR